MRKWVEFNAQSDSVLVTVEVVLKANHSTDTD